MSNRVVLRFIGEDSDLRRALKRIGEDANKVGTGFGKVSKGLAVLGAAGGAVKTINGVVAAGQQLLPIALLLPGAMLSAGAAFATFKLATSGLSEALNGNAKAYEKLRPEARGFVDAVRSMKPELDKLRDAVQSKFFAGLGDDVKALGKTYFPLLQSRLPAIAAGFNTMGRSVAFALTRPDNAKSIDTVLDNTAKMLGKMPNALGHLVTGFVTLGGAGSKYLVPLGRFIDGLTDKFRRWADMLVLSGRFDQLIGAAKAGFSDLGHVIGNVASIVGSIWAGLSGGSGASSPLATLRDMTAALRGFFESAAAQGPLQALGQTFAVVGGVLRDVVLAGLRAVGPLVVALAPIVQTLAAAVGQVLVGAFDQLGPPLTRFINKIAPIANHFLPWLASVITGVVIPAIAGFINWLSNNIDQIQVWAMNTVVAALEAGRIFLTFASMALSAFGMVFTALSHMPGEFGRNMGAAARATGEAKDSVDRMRGTVDLMHSKAIDLRASVIGQMNLDNAKHTVEWFPTVKNVTVNVRANYTGFGAIGGPSLVAAAHGRAVGGTVNKGQAYLVGERGPEIIRMGGSGYVTPNHRIGDSGGGGGGRTVEFIGNVDQVFATYFMQLVRSGKVKIA